MALLRPTFSHSSTHRQVENAKRLVDAEAEHQELIAVMQAEHEAAKAAAIRDHEQLRALLQQHNEVTAAEAVTNFQADVQDAQVGREGRCGEWKGSSVGEAGE
jgi:hypothetical protein